MKKLAPLLVAGLLSSLVLAGGVGAKATVFTTSTTFPIDIPVLVPCANGGAGETVELTGSLHDLFHITINSAGGINVKTHDNPQGITGTGLVTGAKYQGTGVTQDQFSGHVGQEETFINNFRIIGQGTGNNLLIHENFHITVNANGDVTVVHDNFSAECK